MVRNDQKPDYKATALALGRVLHFKRKYKINVNYFENNNYVLNKYVYLHIIKAVVKYGLF